VFTHPGEYDPLLEAPYRMVVGEMGPDKKIVFYDDWKKLGDENARLSPPDKTKKPSLGYDYSAYLALVCGVDAGFPRAAEAVKCVLNTTGGFRGMLAEPTWRIVPREGPAAAPAK
jgi:hypothetical protein